MFGLFSMYAYTLKTKIIRTNETKKERNSCNKKNEKKAEQRMIGSWITQSWSRILNNNNTKRRIEQKEKKKNYWMFMYFCLPIGADIMPLHHGSMTNWVEVETNLISELMSVWFVVILDYI